MSISLSRETIRLMMQSQRIIKKEFGIRIELDDDQVMARVFAYAAQSKSDELKQCAGNLMQQLIPGQAGDAKGEKVEKQSSAVRIYRGQLIEVDASTQTAQAQETSSDSGARKNVIYRGRRVS